MIEKVINYPPEQRKLYLEGIQYARWKRKYRSTRIFCEYIAVEKTTRHIPVKVPPLRSQTYGFGELFAGIYFSDLGYEVSTDYWGKNWDSPSYFRAVEILGPKAADFICKAHPQPPDLFIFDQKGRFFFVEVKLPTDRLNPKQIKFFRQIESHLNKNIPSTNRAEHMPQGQWIQLVKLKPAVLVC